MVRAGYLCTALVLVLSGCAVEPGPPRPLQSGAPVAPSTERERAEEAASAEILAVFAGFQELEARLSADPPPVEDAERLLAEHLAGAMHARVLLTLHVLHRAGLARPGAATSTVEIVALSLDKSPPSATIRECLDTGGWDLVDGRTGPLASDEAPAELYGVVPGRYVRTVQATRYDDGRWLLNDYQRPILQEATAGGARC